MNLSRLIGYAGAIVFVAACKIPGGDETLSLRRFEYEHRQMGALFRLVFYAPPDSAKAQSVARQAFDRVDSLNMAFSDYIPESELSRLCEQAGKGTPTPVSADLWRILKQSQAFSEASGGAFDATIGPLTRLWRRARSLQELPDSARIEAARALTDYRKVAFFPEGRQIQLLKKGMKLDLGGIAQGYPADDCLQILKRHGIRRALVDVSGDIAIGDPPPGQKGWKIAVPGENGAQNWKILANTAITTSGATYKYLEANGRRYSHIVDPRSGWGLTHRVLVTVQAPDCTSADAWATALSVMGEAGWEKIRHKYPEIQVVLSKANL